MLEPQEVFHKLFTKKKPKLIALNLCRPLPEFTEKILSRWVIAKTEFDQKTSNSATVTVRLVPVGVARFILFQLSLFLCIFTWREKNEFNEKVFFFFACKDGVKKKPMSQVWTRQNGV